MLHEIGWRSPLGSKGWDQILQRNEWFSKFAASQLKKHLATSDARPIVFSYAYTAKAVFEVAKRAGCRCVLGQIDPGLAHDVLVANAYKANPHWKPRRQVPSRYWVDWHSECLLADTIVVNSNWSRDSLIREGVKPGKIVVVPVAYESSSTDPDLETFVGDDSEVKNTGGFCVLRPLRVLVIGRATLEKGIENVVAAANLLRHKPLVFDVVGDHSNVPEEHRNIANINWHGNVPRNEVGKWYRNADLMVFPTLSDGFGITQLEAQFHHLPIVVSKNCGDVVIENVNGRRLLSNSAEFLVETLLDCLANPSLVSEWTANSYVREVFSIDQVASRMCEMR
ncbi:glycosyltransferase family 4 protein [Rubripirellula reticaptiva]|nr:glycosyltransferase family 4 protein [Rubripirellula reticaptiva]